MFDGPQQAAGFVEVAVVGPAIEGRKALATGAGTTTTVTDAIGAGGVPGHADEQRSVVPVISRPPLLAVAHHCPDIGFDCGEVECFDGMLVVEITKGVGSGVVLAQDVKVEGIWPPILVLGARCGRGGGTVVWTLLLFV